MLTGYVRSGAGRLPPGTEIDRCERDARRLISMGVAFAVSEQVRGIESIPSMPPSESDLKKMRKGDLIALAQGRGVPVDEADTKTAIIRRLLVEGDPE